MSSQSGAWRVRSALAALLLCAAAAPVSAQGKAINDAVLEQLLKALAAEEEELQQVGPALQEVDAKIEAFEECKELFDAAGGGGGGLGGLAAKAALRAKCGATNTDGFYKEKKEISQRPEKAALEIMKMKSKDYGQLKERVAGYLSGRRDGYTATESAAIDARRDALSAALDVSVAAAGGAVGGGPRGGRGVRSHNFGSPDYAWEYIGSMFQVMYLSGAMAFEKPYQPGQWTRWQLTNTHEASGGETAYVEKAEFERAFLGAGEDGGEWWRTTQIDFYDEDGTQRADTVVLEGLFKGESEYVRQLVRMRGRFPGQAEPQELMVPQAFAMLSLAAFPFQPTEESIKGATIGTETVAGFSARHVKFGGTDGALEWWVADNAPGGWVRFRHSDAASPDVKQPASYVMEMVEHGSGAKSLLGVK